MFDDAGANPARIRITEDQDRLRFYDLRRAVTRFSPFIFRAVDFFELNAVLDGHYPPVGLLDN